jgi:putative Ca2+/H+ antiporter (TMEM165/GDT1 family)
LGVAPIATTRPMTAEERALLGPGSARSIGWWRGIVSALFIFVLTFLLAALLAIRFPYEIVMRGALAAAALASGASYGWIQRKARKTLADGAAVVARDAAAGFVRSTIYRITDAVAVEEEEDEGPSYYLLLDDGRTLFMSGQYLYEPAEDGFPWKSFEVVQVASGKWVLRIVPLGPAIVPSWTRGPFSGAELSSRTMPADGAIEQRDFAALKARR